MIIKTNVKAGGLDTQNHNEKIAKSFVIKTGVKAGGLDTYNHNEKLASDSDINTIEEKKSISNIGKKLRLSKETVRILKDGELRQIAGGAGIPTSTFAQSQTCLNCP
jgi:hypothetical protein